ncbi:MAG: hypothetical protein GX763_06075 [Clostridiaceae bacterium]|nr:hypothetical protein [Clostridiaceae bacterium]
MITAPLEDISVTSLKPLIYDFFSYTEQNNIELYNEFSLQHELGIYLRNILPGYRVQFERNVSYFADVKNTIKKEIDISIFSPDIKEKYAIELKFPLNGQYPEQLYSFVKDIKFMEQVKTLGFLHTYCISLVADRPFYFGNNNHGIYAYFREKHVISGRIYKPTGSGKNIDYIEVDGEYPFVWEELTNGRKFYCIEI